MRVSFRTSLTGMIVAASSFALAAACSSSSDEGVVASDDAGGNDASSGGDVMVIADAASDNAVSDAAAHDSGRAEPSIKLAVGYQTTCAIVSGSVKCWGANSTGQLGDLTVDNLPHTPTPVSGISFTPTFLAVGGDQACASDGTHTSCWGNDGQGQLGNVDASACDGVDNCPFALAVDDLGPIDSMAMDLSSTYVISSGAVRAFGVFDFTPTGVDSNPRNLPGAQSNVNQVVLNDNTICTLQSDGGVSCLGVNYFGGLGEGDGGTPSADAGFDSNNHPALTQIAGVDAKQISMGDRFGCALLGDGTVKCWGDNMAFGAEPGGELGHDPLLDPICTNAITHCDPTPSAVLGLTNVREISCGYIFACAVKNDDTVVCWGDNMYGELGNAPTISDAGNLYNFMPQKIAALSNVAHVVTGYTHACAVTWDDHVFCWGDNSVGELGIPLVDGGPEISRTPVTPQGF